LSNNKVVILDEDFNPYSTSNPLPIAIANPGEALRWDAMKEPTGFPNRSDSEFSFDNSSRTFSIAPFDVSYDIYSNGIKYTKSSTETVTITDTEGLWFFYFSNTGVLTASQTPWTFDASLVFIALGYWDASNNLLIGLGDERHGMTMDNATHEYLHNNLGAQWVSGFTPAVTVDQNGSLAAHCEIQSISAGVFYDEDIKHSTLQQTSYQVWYLEGASASWRAATASASAVNVTSTRPNYNLNTAGTWSRAQVDNNNYVLTHIFATNDVNKPTILVMGQAQYSSKANARAGATTELANLTTGAFPMAEFCPIATLIVECKDVYTNTYNAILVSTDTGASFVDWRTSEKSGVGASPTDHGNLTGLLDDDHTQYSLINGSRAFTSTTTHTNIIDSGLTASQAVLTDANKQLVSQDYLNQAVKTTSSPTFVRIKGESKLCPVTIVNPAGFYAIDTQFPFLYTDAAITVTRVVVTTNTASSSYPVAGDVKWADDMTSLTNATVINAFDTTNGVLDDSSITAGSVAAGKWLYLQLDSAPNAAVTFMCVEVFWDYD
jgi:hypothetical protein